MWQKFKNYYHFFQALVCAIYFQFPSKKMEVIGVTGTDGKTTTVNMLYHILNSSGKNVSMISSISAKIGKKDYATGFHVSTPSSWQVQKYLKEALDAKSEYFILEATSHGLDQNRLAFIDFKIGILTNITHEHLDYHKNWHNYALSKLKLLKNSKKKIANLDDASFDLVRKKINGKILTYSKNKKADVNLKNFPVKLNIDGDYNLSNALAAYSAAASIGISKQQILKALSNFKGIKGRLDSVDLGQNFKVYIDFAHTPNALKNALTTLRSKAQKGGKLIAVFGSAGARDSKKRPMMGTIASEIADVIVLTSEDPRNENPYQICEQIAKGIKNKIVNKDYFIIINRTQAINFAIDLAKDNDTVGLFGKGHEKTINIQGKEHPWDEVKTAQDAIKKRLKRK